MTTTSVISPEQFKNAFLTVVRGREAELLPNWDNYAAFTQCMLQGDNSVCKQVANILGSKYCPEYWKIDAVLFTELHTKYIAPRHECVEYISVAIEHENNGYKAHEEINKLTLLNTPLKVLITYIERADVKRKLEEFSEMTQAADIFADFTTTRKHLIILGFRESGSIEWDSYVFKSGVFTLI